MNRILPGWDDSIEPTDSVKRSSDLTKLEVWQALRRHRWLVINSILITTVLAAIHTIRAPRVYEATTTIRIEDEQINLPELVRQLSPSNEVTTEMQVLQSRELATEVIDSLRLRLQVVRPAGVDREALLTEVTVASDAPEGEYHLIQEEPGTFVAHGAGGGPGTPAPFGSAVRLPGISFKLTPAAERYNEVVLLMAPLEKAVDAFVARTTVSRPARDANIINVNFRGPDPRLVYRIPNLMAARFIENRQEVEKSQAHGTVKFLRQQLDTMRVQLAVAEQELRRFREREGVINLSQEETSQVARLAELNAERATIEAERGALAALLQSITDRPDSILAGGPSRYRRLIAFPTLLRNQATSELFRSLAALEDQRAQLLMRKTQADPDVQVLTGRIAELDNQLQTIATTYLQGLSNQVSALDTSLVRFHSELERIPAKEVAYSRRARESKVLEEMYTLLQTRLKEAEIAQASENPSVRVIDRATLPSEAVSPRPLVNLALGVFAGLIVALVGAVLVERRNPSVRSRADVATITGSPVLGLIPRISGLGSWHRRIKRGRRPGRLSRRARVALPLGAGAKMPAYETSVNSTAVPAEFPLSGISAEAYGRLGTNIVFSGAGNKVGILLITSSMSEEGKTTTAAGLALTLAQQGCKTLLVDGDLRRGVVNRVFGLGRAPGLSEVLDGSRELSEVINSVRQGRLNVLTTGRLPANPVALLAPERIHPVFERLRSDYEAVIIDSPPLNAVTDAALLATVANEVVVVVRAGCTMMEALSLTMEQLRTVRVSVSGIVLNDIDFEKDAVYDSAYEYYGQDKRYYTQVE